MKVFGGNESIWVQRFVRVVRLQAQCAAGFFEDAFDKVDQEICVNIIEPLLEQFGGLSGE